MDGKIKKSFAIYLIKTVVTTFVPLIIFPYASRVLGAANIGKVQYAQSIIGYFLMIATLGISPYAIREGAKCRDDKSKLGKLSTELLLINLITSAVAYCALFISLAAIPKLQEYTPLLLLFSISMFTNTIGIEWFYNIVEEYTYITVRTVIFQLLSVVCLFLVVRAPEDYFWYACILVIPTAISNVVNLVHSRKLVRLFGYKDLSLIRHFKPMLLVFGIYMAGNIYINLDVTMLGSMIDDTAVGLYSSASKVSRTVVTVITAMCSVFLPRISYYLSRREMKQFFDTLSNATNVILIFGVPAAIGLSVLAPEVIMLFSGADFMGAVPAMRVLSINILLSAVNGLLSWQILMPLNRERFILLSSIVGAVLDFVINLWLIPLYGVAGAASATMLAELAVFVLTLLVLSKMDIDMKALFSSTWQYILAAVPFFFIRPIIGIWASNTVLLTVLTVGICASIYFLILALLKNSLVHTALKDGKGIVGKFLTNARRK